MKTLKIALASALIVLSLNAFAENCDPCPAITKLPDTTVLQEGNMPPDAAVSNMLQQMTVTVHQQVINTTIASKVKKQKHSKKRNAANLSPALSSKN